MWQAEIGHQHYLYPISLGSAMNESDRLSPLGPIRDHLCNFRWLVSYIAVLGTIPPLLDFYLNIGPPWPHRRGVAYFTTVALWIVILWTHSQWHNTGQARLKKAVNSSAIFAIISLLTFMVLTAFFVENAPDSVHQIAKGFFLLPEQKKILEGGVFPDGTPFSANTIQDLLAANSWKAEDIYPAWTVYLMRYSLLCSWLIFFGSLSGLTSVFLLLQEKKVVRKSNKKKDNPDN